MSFRRACLALLLSVATLRAAGPKVEMRTLKGEIIPGELVSITKAEVVINRAESKVTTPTPQVLLLDFPGAAKVTPPEKFLDVELVDGSIFHCAAVAFKPKQLTMTLASGQELTVPLIKVSNVLSQAQDEKYRKEWSKYLGTKRKSDIVSFLNDGVPNHFEVTINSISEDGKDITFTLLDGDNKLTRKLEKVHGLIWDRAADPNMPLSMCKLIDVTGSVVMIEDLTLKGDNVELTTPGGVKLEYPLKSIGKLDYNRDKLRYLSEMDWKVVKEPEDAFFKPYKDTNGDKGPIRLGANTYAKGLFLNAYTELIFDLGGDFREFTTLAGIDPTVGGGKAPVTLIIECDGREREKRVFNRDDKEPFVPLRIPVKDVQKLRITVSTDKIPFGGHLTLADAKVVK
jgi:hypothetical protein